MCNQDYEKKIGQKVRHFSFGIYLLKVNNRNTKTRREICSKLKIKTLERRLESSEKDKVVKTFKIFSGCHIRACRSLKPWSQEIT